jgi:hypothetical protein
LLTAGIAALLTRQAYEVWFGLGLPGLIGLAVLGGNLPMVLWAYRAAEERRMAAQHLRL